MGSFGGPEMASVKTCIQSLFNSKILGLIQLHCSWDPKDWDTVLNSTLS